MIVSGKNTLELIIAARDRTRGAFTKVGTQINGMRGSTKNLHTSLSRVKGSMSNLVGVAGKLAGIIGPIGLAASAGAAVKAFVDFEDAMANVRKTTGMSKDEISDLGDSIKELALRIPAAATELASIAAIAGQLGIVGKENILNFTEDVAKMTTAFDMSAEEVAIAMAKLSNIYDIPIEQTSNLGSAINVLGNTTAASESQIMAFSMALGPAAQQLGFAATEAISLGASMIGIGMDASSAGTRLNRAFSMIGQNLDEVSGFMGVSVDEFKRSFEEMPMETFMEILQKLSMVEGRLEANTVASKLFNEVGAKAIKGLTGDLDGLRTNLKNSAKGFEENTSLTEEFAAKTDTLKARFTLLKNSVMDLLIDMGGEIAPAITGVIENLREILPAVKELVLEVGHGFGEMFESVTRQAGPALEPLMAKLKETGDAIRSGLNFKIIADDIGVFIGAGLNPLIRAFTWLIDKLGPLWDLLSKAADGFHTLANALKTEEGRLDDILDATRDVTAAKQNLFEINEMLAANTKTLASELESAGAWTSALSELEAEAEEKTKALADARKIASEAIAKHGADSEIARAAIDNVKQAEIDAQTATDGFNSVLQTAAQTLIDTGVATDGVQKAQLDFITSTEDATTAQEGLGTAVDALERELEEAKKAPFDLGESFKAFGSKVEAIFAALPMRVGEAIAGILEKTADGLDKIKLTGLAEKYDNAAKAIREKIGSIRDSMEVEIPEGMKVAQEAADNAATAIVESFEGVEKELTDVEKTLENSKGSYKDAIWDITKEIEELKKTWVLAGEAEKQIIETQIHELETLKNKLNEGQEEQKEFFKLTVEKAEEAAEALEDFKVTIGDTTIEFKNAAGEVIKNADAYEKLHNSAKKLMDLDWSVFTKFEAALPNIDSGIKNMADSFLGLEEVLERNIDDLEIVREAVMKISKIGAPFTEKGFLEGIKGIRDFATGIRDAGSAINTFSSLQDISIDGCINFSLHVRDMVSALAILEDQMEDLVPDFADMNSLITNILETFVWTPGKKDSIADEINRIAHAAKDGSGTIGELWTILEDTTKFTETGWLGEFAAPFIERYKEGAEDIEDITEDFLASGEVLERQFGYTTDALAFQTGQLSKITDALQPYLEFMSTLNELAKLSAISTADLNNGLNAIKETLTNLGSEISAFDLRPVMEGLFGTKITEGDLVGEFTGGSVTPFIGAMEEYQRQFHEMIEYTTRLTSSVSILAGAFDALQDISKNVLTDQEKLKVLFDDITLIMANFAKEMNAEGASALAEGMNEMIKSAEPLMVFFADNNAAVTKFNNTLGAFKSTLTNVVGAMGMLKDIAETTLPKVEELEAGFSKAQEGILRLNQALLNHVGVGKETIDMEKELDNVFTAIPKFAENWEKSINALDDSMPVFNTAMNNFGSLATMVISLNAAFLTLKDTALISSRDMEKAFDNIGIFVVRFTEALRLNLDALVDALIDLDIEWDAYAKDMEETMPSYKTATREIGNLVASLMSLTSSLQSLAETGAITSKVFDTGFGSLIKSISNFGTSLNTNIVPLVTVLRTLRATWIENEESLVPLMIDFQMISKSFIMMAVNANNMVGAFKDLGRNSFWLERGFETLITFIKAVAKKTEEFYTPENAAALNAYIKDVGSVIQSFKDLDSEIESAVGDIENKISDSVRDIENTLSTLSNLNATMYFSGQSIMLSFIAGLRSFHWLLVQDLQNIASTIEDYLKVASPAKLGPLQHIEEWPKNLMKTFSKGLQGEMGLVNNAFNTMATPMGGEGGSRNSTSVTFNVTQKISDRATADYSTRELEKMLNKHQVM